MPSRIIATSLAAVAAVALTACKTGEDLTLPNQSAGIDCATPFRSCTNIKLAAVSTPSSSTAWVCSTLDANPTEAGVSDLLLEAYLRGFRSEADAKQLVQAVVSGCPEYVPLLTQWAENYDG